MGELEIKLASGGHAVVKGTPAEIAEVLRLAGLAGGSAATPAPVANSARVGRRRRSVAKPSTGARSYKKKTGPRARVEKLIADGFFKGRKTLTDVRDELRRGGHVYKATDLSPTMIRLVRDEQLRRVKGESGRWAYAER